MPGIEDWIHDPLQIIQRLFDEDPAPKEHARKVDEFFHQRVNEDSSKGWIPSLNNTPSHNLQTNTLVRFRGMIQDMHDPEYYLGVYEVEDTNSGKLCLRSGKYKDVAHCGPTEKINLESQKNVTLDRQLIYCVPIPGETEWVKSTYAETGGKSSQPSVSDPACRSKRSLDDDGENDCAMEEDGKMETSEAAGTSTSTDEGSRKKTKQEGSKAESKSKIPDLNFPLPNEKGPACLVKIYGSDSDLRLNDIVEVVGVLSNDPAMADFPKDGALSSFQDPSSNELMEGLEEEDNSPPPSLVPRLHALVVKKLQHNNPLLPLGDGDASSIQAQLNETREQLLSTLSQALLGDKLAAQYLLCHLLSTVYTRKDVVALGKFSLNLSQCPRESTFPNLLYTFLQSLVTKSHFLPMTLDNMNKLKFTPRKDYIANRLTSGILQLCPQTHLVVDETALQPGQLDTAGVSNITALGNVVTWQKLDYDFNFHKQEFHTNIQVLVMSEGKSILKCDCQVPVNPSSSSQNLDQTYRDLDTSLNPAVLNRMRAYITHTQNLEYTLAQDVQEVVQEDFVSKRKEDPKNFTVEDFHSLLVLARLLALSKAEQSLSLDTWNLAKQMETERKSRLKHVPGASDVSAAS